MFLKMSQSPDQNPKYRLSIQARRELGTVSPELAWERLQALYQHAVQESYQETRKLALKYNLPVDLRNLTEALALLKPVRAINLFAESNPEFNLQQEPAKTDPLKVVEALLKMVMLNDRYQLPANQPNQVSV